MLGDKSSICVCSSSLMWLIHGRIPTGVPRTRAWRPRRRQGERGRWRGDACLLNRSYVREVVGGGGGGFTVRRSGGRRRAGGSGWGGGGGGGGGGAAPRSEGCGTNRRGSRRQRRSPVPAAAAAAAVCHPRLLPPRGEAQEQDRNVVGPIWGERAWLAPEKGPWRPGSEQRAVEASRAVHSEQVGPWRAHREAALFFLGTRLRCSRAVAALPLYAD
jgi:hypothetical protein